MMIVLVSDLHGDFTSLERMIALEMPDFIIGAGDLTEYWYDEFMIPIYTIFGNHENWLMINHVRDQQRLQTQLKRIKNLNVLETGQLYEVNGYTIAGLNGNFAKYPREPWHIVMEDVETCKKLQHVDFFISHEPPRGVADVLHKNHVGNDQVREILDRIKPRFMICGHIHRPQKERYEDTTVITLGKGSHGHYAIFHDGKIEMKKLSDE